jgi:hypothetical protein
MGISHQTGSIVQRGRAWYGFYRKDVIDATTEDVRSVRVCVRLGLKSQMTKLKARDALKAEIAKQTGQLTDGRILKDGSVTFEWFVCNRYFPLRQGYWRPETAKEKTAHIEIDLIGKFGSRTIESIDKFEFQTHVNHLAKDLLPGSGEAGALLSQVHLRRSNRARVPGQRSDPDAEDSQEPPAEG